LYIYLKAYLIFLYIKLSNIFDVNRLIKNVLKKYLSMATVIPLCMHVWNKRNKQNLNLYDYDYDM